MSVTQGFTSVEICVRKIILLFLFFSCNVDIWSSIYKEWS